MVPRDTPLCHLVTQVEDGGLDSWTEQNGSSNRRTAGQTSFAMREPGEQRPLPTPSESAPARTIAVYALFLETTYFS